jgi:hypothetical protein
MLAATLGFHACGLLRTFRLLVTCFPVHTKYKYFTKKPVETARKPVKTSQ